MVVFLLHTDMLVQTSWVKKTMVPLFLLCKNLNKWNKQFKAATKWVYIMILFIWNSKQTQLNSGDRVQNLCYLSAMWTKRWHGGAFHMICLVFTWIYIFVKIHWNIHLSFTYMKYLHIRNFMYVLSQFKKIL